MKKLLPTLLLFLIVFSAFSQEDCGTKILPEQEQFLENLEKQWEAKRKTFRVNATSMKMIPVKVHIIRKSDGTGGITIEQVREAINYTNNLYIKANIQFFICGPEAYINNTTYYDFIETTESNLRSISYVNNMLNIYFANSVTSSSGSNLCGYAYFPGSYDLVMMNNSCAVNGSTLAHEIGHYFNLYHTHQGGNELVNGSNCGTAGDRCCDTPADNNLSGKVGAGCVYTGTDTDANGQKYNPSTINLMSYSSKSCRLEFTPEQYARMKYAADNFRNYLTCNSTVPLDAEFIVNNTYSCDNSLNVQFHSTSLGFPTSWHWNFGDGSSGSTQENPTHTYTAPGVYNVSLTTQKGGTSNTETKNYLIAVGAVKLPYSENFETGPASLGKFKKETGFANFLNVLSDGANASSYGLVMEGAPNTNSNFDTPTSLDPFGEKVNPMFRAKAELCVDATTYATLKLSFDLKQVYDYNNAYTNFRVLVNGNQIGSVYRPSGATTAWKKIDLDLSAYAGNIVTITFESSCKYSRNYDDPKGNANYIDNISITGTPITIANFTSDQSNICEAASVTFTDQSTNATSWNWSFGEGATPSTATGAGPHVVTYSSAGQKTVSLNINNGADIESKPNYITVKPNPTASATPSSVSICSGTPAQFNLNSDITGTLFSWTVNTVEGITGATSGSGTSINQTLTNNKNAAADIIYSITPTANGCQGAKIDVPVTVKPIPVALASATDSEICSNSTTDISISSSVNGTEFNWTAQYSAGLTGTTSGTGEFIEERLTLDGASEGTAVYEITPIANNCTGETTDISITVVPCITATVAAAKNSSLVSISPNPFTEYTHMKLNGSVQPTEITITNITGKAIYNDSKASTEWVIGEQLEPGIYFCTIRNEEKIEVIKLIKR
ncbi:MAG TPA: PKD-like domain-containing protein [Cytophagaceae bacterium]